MNDQLTVQKTLNTLLESESPDIQAAEVQRQVAALETYPTQELEAMLQDPELGHPANRAVRDEILRVLADRCGADFVNNLIKNVERQGGGWAFYATSQEQAGSTQESSAQRAKDAFKAFDLPLADLIPDKVESFIIDESGIFYLELTDTKFLHMQGYELVLDKFITGWMEPYKVTGLTGIHAIKDIYTETVELAFTSLEVVGQMAIITTDHPMASQIEMPIDDLITIA